jgi:hypothetical protein
MTMMQHLMHRRRWIATMRTLAATWLLSAAPAAGEDLQGEATMPAPSRVVINTMAMSPSSAGLSAEALQRLRQHLLEKEESRTRKLLAAPPGALAMATPLP